MQTRNQVKRGKRGEAGFDLSDAYWLQVIGPQCPEFTLFINEKSLSGLLETGADVSVTTASQGPSMRPKMETIAQLQGIGPEQSNKKLSWKNEEGHEGTFWPYIVPHLSVNLWS